MMVEGVNALCLFLGAWHKWHKGNLEGNWRIFAGWLGLKCFRGSLWEAWGKFGGDRRRGIICLMSGSMEGGRVIVKNRGKRIKLMMESNNKMLKK